MRTMLADIRLVDIALPITSARQYRLIAPRCCRDDDFTAVRTIRNSRLQRDQSEVTFIWRHSRYVRDRAGGLAANYALMLAGNGVDTNGGVRQIARRRCQKRASAPQLPAAEKAMSNEA